MHHLRTIVGCMTIEPDTKDWTWVLDEACPECGLDTRTIGRYDVSSQIRSNAAGWQQVLRSPLVRRRPAPRTWSPLEYGCHVRDVFLIFRTRLHLMLDLDNPKFPNWNQDETAMIERYSEQDPIVVAPQLLDAADLLAADFARLTDQQWLRPGRRSDGARFTVESFSRYLIHDPVHHLYDVTRS
jgi:DinB superfamily